MPPSDQSPLPPCALLADDGVLASRREFLRETASLVACAAMFGGVSSRWVAALRLEGGEAVYPIPPQDATTIDRDHEAILVRFDNRVYAFVLWCPHQHTALRWQDEARRFQCPKHKSTFEPDGDFLSGRATRGLDRYALKREGDTVVVDLATVLRQDKDPERWGQAVVQL
jgi:nitrite reductase/ring-hydroxylating ferredoxin subunit